MTNSQIDSLQTIKDCIGRVSDVLCGHLTSDERTIVYLTLAKHYGDLASAPRWIRATRDVDTGELISYTSKDGVEWAKDNEAKKPRGDSDTPMLLKKQAG